MALPLPTPKPPVPRDDDFAGLEDLDRPELDEAPDTDPMTDPMLTPLDWDQDLDSGIVTKKKRA
jgi:hypothetical protein